jgi:electron transfer flavoprotein beta subunit
MKIIVCAKRVGHAYHSSTVDLSTGHIDPGKMVFMLNPYDEIAVEEAIRIKEHISDCEIILITLGIFEAEETLRYAFAMGGRRINRMIRINYESFDPWETALALSNVIKKIGFDIILCGEKAIDDNCSQVGTFVAELLNIPQVSGIVKLDIVPQGKKTLVERYLGKGDREEMECCLPALFTVGKGLNDPRYPSLPNRILAEKMKIEEIDWIDLEFGSEEKALTKVTKFFSPKPKTRKMFTPDSSLSALERLNLMMSGSSSKKEGSTVLEGSANQLADHLVKFLVQNKFLSKEDK